MIITIVNLYDDFLTVHYTGAIVGKVDPDRREVIAMRYNAHQDGKPGAHEEDGRTISFTEVDVSEATPAKLLNIWPEGK